MFWVIRQLPGSYNLRLSEEGELEGLDIHEHGTPAYHMEFGYGMSYTSPAGLTGQGNRPGLLAGGRVRTGLDLAGCRQDGRPGATAPRARST